MVRSECRLVEAVVAKPGLIDPAGIRRKGPVRSHYLGPGMNLRQPLRLQFPRIIDSSGVVAKEIQPAQGVAIRYAVVNLTDRVVVIHGIRESFVNQARASRIVSVV